MPAFRFTAPVVAGAALFGAYVALQLLQAFLTHVQGKPDPSLVQILAAFTPVMIGVVGVLGATAMTKSANADHRSQRTETAVKEALNGAAVVPLKDGENHGDTPQVSPGS